MGSFIEAKEISSRSISDQVSQSVLAAAINLLGQQSALGFAKEISEK